MDTKIDIIKKIINKYDPVHLIKMGASDDEYASEIYTLFKLIDHSQHLNVQELKGIIMQVFIEYFDKEIVTRNSDLYEKIANEILDSLK